MTTFLLATTMIVLGAAELPAWEFDGTESLSPWVANAHLAEAAIDDGRLIATGVDWDPFFLCDGLSFETTPWQYVILRIKADRAGQGELFWTGLTEGQYGGLSEKKRTSFMVPGDSAWHEIVIFPFWHTEKVIRKLRLDVYDDARFEIDWIRLQAWGEGESPDTTTRSWTFNGTPGDWKRHPAADAYFAEPLHLSVADAGWISLRLRADKDTVGKVIWSSPGMLGAHEEEFPIHGDEALRYYNVEAQSAPGWGDTINAFGLSWPEESGVYIESVAISDRPLGPPELEVTYFGFENAINRAERPCRILAHVTNSGGDAASIQKLYLDLPPGLKMLQAPDAATMRAIPYGEASTLVWEVQAEQAESIPLHLSIVSDGNDVTHTTTLSFAPPLDLPPAIYVPEPRPVETSVEVCAYYFPGWGNDAAWDSIRRVAPIRKPLLGYYDESSVECVDWQIKWASENGISCFLVDWYWNQGAQHLTHWFDAYREAKYREYLKVAIMWANHLPPGSHSREDWRNVTQEWIDHYFTLDTYYHIDGKPAVFIWDPRNIRNDLGGTDSVKEAFAESQSMAQAAGYEGIAFYALFGHESSALRTLLEEEGYVGVTDYHEWGRAEEKALSPMRMHFSDVAETAPHVWRERLEESRPLDYIPVVDSGWDSRPWHGNKARVIDGRSVSDFEKLLSEARTFATVQNRPRVILGPLNEWGEGSYLEPNTEFGFGMYEAIRRVFAQGDPNTWPTNIAPQDVGMGPYDFPASVPTSAWSFDSEDHGWAGMMGVSELQVENGALVCTATTHDPGLHTVLSGIHADEHPTLTLRMRLSAESVAESRAQLFWSVAGGRATEATSVTFPVHIDGEWHTYAVDLTQNPRWRGRIPSLRFDPCGRSGTKMEIDLISLAKE